VVSPRAAVVLGLAATLPGAAARADAKRHCDQEICIEVEESADTIRFFAESASPARARIELTFPELENLVSDPPAPVDRWLGPGGETGGREPLATLTRGDPQRSHRYRWKWHLWLGAPEATHDDGVLYRIPFGGETPRQLSQGAGGGYSHDGRMRHCFDFRMPEGTPVLAAREGVVALVRDGFERGGPRKALRDQANRVDVLHEDGTFSEYVHLRKGVEVKVGERVEAGARLGRSGNSGYSSAPHLHFAVWKRAVDGERDSVPVRFEGQPGGYVPVAGSYVAPQGREEERDER
jgi:murein DD-endopeptidase MepM/ murein hydrolase activator NlpD